MKALAPGKIILTGEHAVVYGRPALVTAVDRHATCLITEMDGLFRLELKDYDTRWQGTKKDLRSLAHQLEGRYRQFLDGKITVSRILEQPWHLPAYALAQLVYRCASEHPEGLALELASAIPKGCGMGSSAATALAVLQAACSAWQLDLSKDKIFDLALAAEHMQHGRPSGVDPYISLYGGTARFQEKKAEPLKIDDMPALQLVQTGEPTSSTGECVTAVAAEFGPKGPWDHFEEVANTLQKSLETSNWSVLRDAIRHNNELLVHIGVVPEKVQAFIVELEAVDGAGKICGSGAVSGDAAGILWVSADDDLDALCRDFDYTRLEVTSGAEGTRSAD